MSTPAQSTEKLVGNAARPRGSNQLSRLLSRVLLSVLPQDGLPSTPSSTLSDLQQPLPPPPQPRTPTRMYPAHAVSGNDCLTVDSGTLRQGSRAVQGVRCPLYLVACGAAHIEDWSCCFL
ncbi:hypothetical protein CB1_000345035 [Camelus ferus]|nr:hypothetical protein CB1_000345035 [Camelus ferus]